MYIPNGPTHFDGRKGSETHFVLEINQTALYEPAMRFRNRDRVFLKQGDVSSRHDSQAASGSNRLLDKSQDVKTHFTTLIMLANETGK